MSIKSNLGKQIKKYRQKRGLSQEELAEKLEISQQTLSKIECGKNFLTAETLEKLQNVLGVSISEFFKFDENITAQELLNSIEKGLQLIKTNPEKLACVNRLVHEIAYL